MSRRSIAWVVVIVLGVVSAAGLAWSMFGPGQLVFTQAEIQDRLDRQLPRNVKGVTIERVVVKLGDNRISLQAGLQGQALRQSISAVVSARGAPRYRADANEIYFDADGVTFDKIVIAGKVVPRGDETNRLAAAAVAATEQVAEQGVKSWLETHPVYRFKDDFKGFVLKGSLTHVAIDGDRLVVGFSLWKLTAATATFAFWFLVVVALVLLLLRFPLWGVVSGVTISDP